MRLFHSLRRLLKMQSGSGEPQLTSCPSPRFHSASMFFAALQIERSREGMRTARGHNKRQTAPEHN